MTLGKADDPEVCWSVSSGPLCLLLQQGQAEVQQVVSTCPIEASSSQFNLHGFFTFLHAFISFSTTLIMTDQHTSGSLAFPKDCHMEITAIQILQFTLY